MPRGLRRRRAVAALPSELPVPPRSGRQSVQLLRTYPARWRPYPFAPRGEYSVARGYAKALRAARRLVYVEDQFLWSPVVAGVFAEALRARPGLRMVVVVPTGPDSDNPVLQGVNALAQQRALQTLYAAGGDRVQVYELENRDGTPVYVHAKVCVIDDVWAAVGSANLNRRSWYHDSELTSAVLDEQFARELRLRLWREHLDRVDGDDADLADDVRGSAALSRAAAQLEAWHEQRVGPRPPGRLRRHPTPAVGRVTRVWAAVAARFCDPGTLAQPVLRRSAGQ